jgi:streptogramin lyase
MNIVMNGQAHTFAISPTSTNCAVTGSSVSCAIDISAPDGPLAFAVQALSANGDILSQVSGNATISGTTTIPLALQGVWKSATARFVNAHPTLGAPATLAVNINGYDAAGALIVGPEPYTVPIPIFDGDTSGATQLSAASVTSPSQTVTLSYDGSLVNAVVSAAVPPAQATGQQDILVPVATATEYPIPSGTLAATNAGWGKIFPNADGTLSFLENAAVGRITTGGAITETKLPHYEYDVAKGPDGNVWLVSQTAAQGGTELARLNGDGSLTEFPLPNFDYTELTLGPDGNFWMYNGSAARRVTPGGVVSDFPVGIPSYGGLFHPTSGPDGNIWYVGSSGTAWVIIKVTPAGQATVYPLPASAQPCCSPSLGDLSVGPDGRVYTTLEQQRIGSFDPSGTLSELAPTFTTSLWNQTWSAMTFGPDHALWFSLGASYVAPCHPVLGHMTTSGAFAMLVLPSCSAPGEIIPQPNALVIGPDGNLWYTREHYVGKVIL